MSLTMTVPAAVPSLFQSSVPWTPSLAAKKSVLPTAVRLVGVRARDAGVDVLDRTVPAAVPSLFQSSLPWLRRGGEVKCAVHRDGER